MIGRQFGTFPSQPPNCTLVAPSADFRAVMSLTEYAFRAFRWKNPLAFYTLIDQKASTGTSFTVSRCTVFPSFFAGVTIR